MANLQERGGRLYFNDSSRPADKPNWVAVSRPDAADLARELDQLIFFDTSQEIVDWVLSLANLKRLGRDLVYTEEMMRACLLRLVNRWAWVGHWCC
jgi:hypothetical protein